MGVVGVFFVKFLVVMGWGFFKFEVGELGGEGIWFRGGRVLINFFLVMLVIILVLLLVLLLVMVLGFFL